MKSKSDKNAITLIILIVIAIVLIILSGIIIACCISDNGLINKSKKAKDDQEVLVKEEDEDIALAKHKSNDEHTWVVDNTNTYSDGNVHYICSYPGCGEEKIETNSDGCQHDWEVEKAATCTEEGQQKCKICGLQESIEKIDHTLGNAVKENEKAATCTEDGSYDEVVYCTKCKKELSRKNITEKALGHTSGEKVKENIKYTTCTVGGSYDEVVYCTKCQEELSRDTITENALGHIWKKDSERIDGEAIYYKYKCINKLKNSEGEYECGANLELLHSIEFNNINNWNYRRKFGDSDTSEKVDKSSEKLGIGIRNKEDGETWNVYNKKLDTTSLEKYRVKINISYNISYYEVYKTVRKGWFDYETGWFADYDVDKMFIFGDEGVLGSNGSWYPTFSMESGLKINLGNSKSGTNVVYNPGGTFTGKKDIYFFIGLYDDVAFGRWNNWSWCTIKNVEFIPTTYKFSD